MSRTVNALNPGELATLPEGEHCDGRGLYLAVTGTGGRSWIMKYTWEKRPAKIGLGSLADVSLRQARERRDEIRYGLTKNIDPKAARREAMPAKDVPTFLTFATEYVAEHTKTLRSKKSAEKWHRSVNIYCEILHDKRLDQIEVEDVIAILKPCWLTKPQAMRDCRSHMFAIFAAAATKKHRSRTEMNPAQLKGNLDTVPPFKRKKGEGKAKRNHPSMPYEQIPAFMAELRQKDTMTAWMLQVVILTAVRTVELRQMQWSQIDFAERKWTIDGKFMKNGVPAEVPLTDSVLRVLREMKDMGLPGDYVFPGEKAGQPMSHSAVLRYLKVGLKRPDCTVHGFRASFRSWGQDETEHSHETLEFCLHHITGDAAAEAYKNGKMWKKRMAAFKDWEAFCNGTKPAAPEETKPAAPIDPEAKPATPHLRVVYAA
jgi:integrase